jgi:peptidoglycan/xylan/chitin deacetylase (PgdA/CDA1 family)
MLSHTRSQRDRLAAGFDRPKVKRLMRRLPGWRGVLALNYHRIGDHTASPWDHSLWSASAELFDLQLAVLAAEAEVIAPGDIGAALQDGKPGRRVLITFDDGYRDNFEIAYPLLRKHGLTATFFLATGFIDRPRVAWWDELAWMVRGSRAQALEAGEWLPRTMALDAAGADATIATLTAHYKTLPNERTEAFLDHVAVATGSGRCDPDEAAEMWITWEMARELRRGGMTIGGHTVTHPVLARIPAARQEEEIEGCAGRIEQELGEPMRWFAYPVGARDTFTADTRQILTRGGVQLAFSFYGGHARFSRWDPLDVPRTHVGPELSPEILQGMVWLPGLLAR